jgi:adenosylcobinamide-GDP ribazoletransferase
MIALYGELIAAFLLLTRLPMARLGPAVTQATFADAVWAYPIVGAVIGAIGAAAYIACIQIGSPASLAAIISLSAIVLVTGGLHEDALADMADGFGGGQSREDKLEIMRDSRVGTFAVLALMLTLAIRGAAIVAIGMPSKVALALIVAGSLGRGMMIVPRLLLRPARANGLGAGLSSGSTTRSAVGLVLSAVLAPLFLPLAPALIVTVAAFALALCVSALAWRQIGGYTGDVLGATEVIVECAVLVVLASGTNSARLA